MSDAPSQTARSFFAHKMTMRQILTQRIFPALFLVLLAVLLGGGALWWNSSPVTAEPQNQPLPVSTFLAQRTESYTRERHYTGLLREAKRSLLSFQRSGKVIELSVDEGQAVEAGQTLGRLDDRHVRANKARLAALVEQAQAELAERLAGPRQQTIAAKRAELRAQQSQSQILAKQLARRKQLVETASISREEYETFLFDYQAAEARVEVVQRQLDELLAGTRSEQIVAQRARLAQLDAQLADIAHDLEDTRLVAPFSGRVTRRLLDEGAVVAAGASVLEVIDDTHLEAWVGLPPAAAQTFQVGDQHELVVDGVSIETVVQSLAPEIDQATRTRNVIFRLNRAQTDVLPGQVVRLAVAEQVSQPGYWVPTTALTRGTRGLWSVYVAEDNSMQSVGMQSVVVRRDVELLDTVGAKSYVRGSLQPGDRIIASGTHRIVVGQHVAPQEP